VPPRLPIKRKFVTGPNAELAARLHEAGELGRMGSTARARAIFDELARDQETAPLVYLERAEFELGVGSYVDAIAFAARAAKDPRLASRASKIRESAELRIKR
jgi:hypothetical protein